MFAPTPRNVHITRISGTKTSLGWPPIGNPLSFVGMWLAQWLSAGPAWHLSGAGLRPGGHDSQHETKDLQPELCVANMLLLRLNRGGVSSISLRNCCSQSMWTIPHSCHIVHSAWYSILEWCAPSPRLSFYFKL